MQQMSSLFNDLYDIGGPLGKSTVLVHLLGDSYICMHMYYIRCRECKIPVDPEELAN